MRSFFATHWKSIVALILLVLLAVLTMSPGAARADLPARLRQHVAAIASTDHGSGGLERAARYIESALADDGYRVRRPQYHGAGVAVRNIEVSLANLRAGERPARLFIVGAHYDCLPGADDNGSGAAAVLELARLLRNMHPAPGTELRFIFFASEGPPGHPGPGDFIAFAGRRESGSLVGQALAAFRGNPGLPAHGLAAPAYEQGVTLSDHAASYGGHGAPSLMIADTAFLRYPYYHTAEGTPDKLDYPGLARVVAGLSHTLRALAGTTAG